MKEQINKTSVAEPKLFILGSALGHNFGSGASSSYSHILAPKTVLQLTWIKKTFLKCNDNWKFDLLQKCNGKILDLRLEDFDYRQHPVLRKCVLYFRAIYFSTQNNYLKCPIWNNSQITTNLGRPILDTGNFFRFVNQLNLDVLKNSVFDDLMVKDRMKSLAEVNRHLNIELSLISYMRLGECLVKFKNKSKPSVNVSTVPFPLPRFLTKKTAGSKSFRKIFIVNKLKRKNVRNLRQVSSFYKLIELERGRESSIERNLSLWSFHGLNNRIRLCVAKKILPPAEETFIHLFFSCPVTSGWQKKLSLKKGLLPSIRFL